MNYSQAWQRQLDYYNSLSQKFDWEHVVQRQNLNDPKNEKAENLIILNKPVWVEIHELISENPFRKIKAISKYNAYFDGTYRGMPYSLSLGCLHGWDYTIDGHTLDLNNTYENDNNQEKLLEFLSLYSDSLMPQIPKGILKIPAII